MSVISDYKSAPFDVFTQPAATSSFNGTYTPPTPGYTPIVVGYGGANTYDYSYDSICGTRFNTSDGRQVIVVRNGGSAVAAAAIGSGLLVQAPAEITAFNSLAMTVPAATPATAGTYAILATNGATVLNANQFASGYLIVNAGTGIGQTLQIASHAPAAASATFVITLQDPIQVTLDATSTVTLVANPYLDVAISATGLTGTIVGASYYTIGAGTASTYDATLGTLTTQGQPVYAFVGVHGIWGVRADATGTPAVGLPASASTTTAGDVTVFTAAKQYIGNMAGTATSAKTAPVDLKL